MAEERVTRTPDEDGYVLSLRDSKVFVREVAVGVFDIRLQGVGHGAFATEVQRELLRRIGDGHTVSVCVDASELGGYESEFRRAWTQWFMENKGRYDRVVILVRSQLVRMGVNMVNPLIGNVIHAVSDRASYDKALREAVTRAASRGATRVAG